ncbi:phage tail tape measure protein [Mycetocola miduiensis]|uniref:Phage tail tape measure protein, TP901 family, core region n=1 Tax=Mycetocola miduiensis TaxID=995034 RepID=A0A1I5AUF8_9MICO|nr:phage tail tape measure protein [Mycetocola miduiensis]SFN66088.1 phage tail tape measure protein, TP901 family, core region [Mycetocola miduiensis]
MFEAGALIYRIQTMGAEVFEKELKANDAALAKAGATAKATGKSTEELGKAQDGTAKKTKTAAKETDELGKSQTATKQKTEEATKATEKSGKALTGMSEDAKRTSREVGQAAVGIGAAFVAVAGLSAKAAMDWESSWAGVTKTVDAPAAKLDEIEEGLRDLTAVLPGTHDEIAAVAEAAGQLGVAADSIVSFTKTMVDLGETTNLTSDEAATAIAQFMNIMQTAPDDVDRLGSALVSLGNNGASTEKDIIFMAQRIAGAGKIIGLSEAEVLSFANALASAGIEVEAGGSAISRIMTDIAKEVSTNGEDLEKWASVAGMSADQFATKFKGAPAEAINLFIQGLGKMADAGGDVFTTLDDLGQKDIRVSNALLSMANAGDLLTDSLATGNKAWEENSALQQEAYKRYQTTESQMAIVQNRVTETAIQFGEVLLPAVRDVTAFIGGLADGLGGMDPELQSVFVQTGLVTGAVLLMGGAMLLAVPKTVELIGAVRALSVMMPTATARMKGFASFMGGPWGLGLAAGVVSVMLLERHLDSLKATSEEVENALFTAKTAADIFDDVGKGREWSAFRDVEADLKNMSEMLDKVSAQDDNVFLRFTTETIGFRNALKTTGERLGVIAQSALPTAQRAFKLMADETDGSQKQLGVLLRQMPQYREALVKQAKEQGINVTTDDEALNLKRLLALATGDTTTKTKAQTEATELLVAAEEEAIAKGEEWRAEIQEQDAAFVSLGGTYDAVVQKNQDVAQSTADATKDTKDSWETFYDGVSIAISDYITELQTQVDAQNNWESNMVLLAGRVSEGMLDELAKLGPEGAPLVAALATASDEELAKLEPLYAEKAAAATGAFATTLANSQAVISAASAQLGEEAAREIATKLSNGTATVEQIMAEYKLEIESSDPNVTVDADTGDATRKLDNFKILMNSIQRRLQITLSGGETGGGSGMADGGRLDFYANGGRSENHVAQFARAGTMRVWAEPETGGEYYIPIAQAKRGRSTQILADAANEFGYQLVPVGAQAFADGGRTGSTAPVVAGGPLIGQVTFENTSEEHARDALEELSFFLRTIQRGGRHGR